MNKFAEAQPLDLQKSCSRGRARRKDDDFLANLLTARKEVPTRRCRRIAYPFQACLGVVVPLKAAMSMLIGMRID
jgi:hypothetical protein